jgi:hypothetical protein
LPNRSGEAPGLRLMVTVFLVFLEQAQRGERAGGFVAVNAGA